MQRCLMVLTLAWLGIAGSVAAQTAPPTGDQHRRYLFAPTGAEMPYRLYVPSTWDGKRSLPILLVLARRGSEREQLSRHGGRAARQARREARLHRRLAARFHAARRVR